VRSWARLPLHKDYHPYLLSKTAAYTEKTPYGSASHLQRSLQATLWLCRAAGWQTKHAWAPPYATVLMTVLVSRQKHRSDALMELETRSVP